MNYDPVSKTPDNFELMDTSTANGRNSNLNTDNNNGGGLFSCFFSNNSDSDGDDEDSKRDDEERRQKKEEERKKNEDEFETKLTSMPTQQRLYYFAKQGNLTELKKIPKLEINKAAKDTEGLPSAGDEHPYATENSALHFAVLSFNINCVDMVWSSFTDDINQQNKLGSTPLHLAASLGCTEIVQWLINKKADTEARNKIGNTALHCAVIAGYVQTTEVLLESADDPLQSLTTNLNGVGMTPQKYATSDRMQELLGKYLPIKDAFEEDEEYGNENQEYVDNNDTNGNDVQEEPPVDDYP